MSDELQRIAERYERRKQLPPDRYSRLNPAVAAMVRERQRALVRILPRAGITDLTTTQVLEVGCGHGGNLLELIQLGATPENPVANELLPERMEAARRVLPQGVRVLPGDASQLGFETASFDLVYASTVFSSILDPAFQEALASSLWSWVRPGGGILWYDFTVNNPSNRDVRGVPLRRVHQLFPEGKLLTRRVTLAPPLARAIVKLHPALYEVVNVLPFLRTHILGYIKKQ